MKYSYLLLIFFALHNSFAQNGNIQGTITVANEPTALVQVYLQNTQMGTVTNDKGAFSIHEVPFGEYTLVAQYIGYTEVSTTVVVSAENPSATINLALNEASMQLDEMVVTATKTAKRQRDAAVMVNVINSKTIQNVQACNLSESLQFQPGLRVETDCQTCNYQQLRMNGLAGGYSQILINGRPIFSPLTSLYGMEQLPANMIDRIEVVRGGGSSLYGSSAIGGTVNVITTIPDDNSYELNYNYQLIGGATDDHTLAANATVVSENKNSGVSFFINHRERGFYDENDDNFSEIPMLNNTSVGANLFLLPSDNQKIEVSVSHLHEYRFGGEMRTDIPAFLTQQSEERTHNVWMGSADYQINFNEDNSSLITYLAWQQTDRNHYTGIQPDEGTQAYEDFIMNPPYGTSDVSTYNAGLQLNHKVTNFFGGTNVFTFGAEYVYDTVLDEIPTYEYLIDQTTKDVGTFIQSDWELLPQLNLLSGIRMDKHNLLDKVVWSPRASLLYKYKKNTQFRFSYGTGFRAPQAFDTDLHIAFAGGGVSRVRLSPDLTQERSQSFSTSINYDKAMETWIAGFTLEGFYNRLTDAFFLQPVGEDEHGQLFEKQNGDGATVQGITLELRANFNRKLELEGGFTLQSSKFDEAVSYIDGLEGIRDFTRTPSNYGYAIATWTPNEAWSTTLNYVYTGSMQVPHFAGAPNQMVDEMVSTPSFSELSTKVGYTFAVPQLGNKMQVYAGLKNIFNAYQDDFDIGKNRDSNYIYGPSMPRTVYLGIKLVSE